MKTINRISIVVTPREPYFTWARSIDQQAATLELAEIEFRLVYLVEVPDTWTPDEVIRRHILEIFEEQLHSWHRIKNRWPASRSLRKFREWFNANADVIDMVWDLSGSPIVGDGE